MLQKRAVPAQSQVHPQPKTSPHQGVMKMAVHSHATAWGLAAIKRRWAREDTEKSPANERGEWLPGRDSNPDRQIQSLLSYH